MGCCRDGRRVGVRGPLAVEKDAGGTGVLDEAAVEEHLAGVDGVETGGVPVVVGLAGPCPSVRSGAVDSGTMKPPPTAIAGSYGS